MRENNEKRHPADLPAVKLAAGLLVLLCQWLPPAAAPAAAARIYPSAGSTSAAFLKLGVGARAVALGGAFTAVPGDPYDVYWNPAGLADLDSGKRAGFFHNEYFQGLGQEFLVYTTPAGALKLPLAGRPRGGALGFGLDYFYTPKDMERRSGLNEADPLNPISPSEGRFGAYDLAFTAAYGWRAAPDLRLGAGLKVIRQTIDDMSAGSAALDLGLMRDLVYKGRPYTAGLSVQNLGPGIKFSDRRYGLPLVFKAGLSTRLENTGALLALEADKPVDNYPSAAFAVEYPLSGRLALRTAYRYRLHGNELGPWSGFSAGAGVAFEKLSFDYAFTPFGAIGDSHRFSVNFRFGGAPAPEGARAQAPAPAPAGAARFAFRTAPRALAISRDGIKYELKASSPECALYALTFRTLVQGEAPAEFSASEGGLPPGAAGLPQGARPLKYWQLPALPGRVQGDVKVEFRLPKAAAAPGSVALLYMAGGSWRDGAAAFSGEDGEFYLFTAVVPPSQAYAAAARD